ARHHALQLSGFVTVSLIDAGVTAPTATAFGAPPWSTPVNLTRIAGPGFAAMSRADIRNVLFLPDGFVDDPISTDKFDYEFHVRELVHLMNTNSQTRPYD